MFKAISIDDEKPNHLIIERSLKNNDLIEIVKHYTCTNHLLMDLSHISPDIAFLDIEMPEMNGLELAEKIHNICPHTEIVFITAYSEYAIDAFKVNALDYLLKPIDQKEMTRVLNKLIQNLSLKTISEKNYSKNEFKINCMEKLEIFTNGKSMNIHWITSKVQELFSYLLLYENSQINKWEICELLWPNYPPDKAKTNLHTSIYRLKKVLSDFQIPAKIISNTNSYKIEIDKNIIDFKLFENSASLALDQNKKQLDTLKYTETLYKGEPFKTSGYPWISSYSEYLNQLYIKLVYKICNFFYENSDLLMELEYLSKIAFHFPYEERACIEIINIYTHQKNKSGLITFYENYKKKLMEYSDCSPSKIIHTAYKNGIKKI